VSISSSGLVGGIVASSLVLPAGTPNVGSIAQANQIQWVRQSDGALVASIGAFNDPLVPTLDGMVISAGGSATGSQQSQVLISAANSAGQNTAYIQVNNNTGQGNVQLEANTQVGVDITTTPGINKTLLDLNNYSSFYLNPKIITVSTVANPWDLLVDGATSPITLTFPSNPLNGDRVGFWPNAGDVIQCQAGQSVWIGGASGGSNFTIPNPWNGTVIPFVWDAGDAAWVSENQLQASGDLAGFYGSPQVQFIRNGFIPVTSGHNWPQVVDGGSASVSWAGGTSFSSIVNIQPTYTPQGGNTIVVTGQSNSGGLGGYPVFQARWNAASNLWNVQAQVPGAAPAAGQTSVFGWVSFAWN